MIQKSSCAAAGLAAVLLLVLLSGCRASAPGGVETALADKFKQSTIGGKGWNNPSPDTPETVKTGAEHFQHHCGLCHGLDGHNTGVPFADKMSPPVADLGSPDVQKFTDGQLKWIITNGIRFTGMPGWTGILEDDEQWAIVRFLRHLPAKGSLGIPAIYKEEQEEHQMMMQGAKPGQKAAEPAHHHH